MLPADMAHAAQIALQLVDPRGRCDRKGFLIAATLLLSAQGLIALGLWLWGLGFDGWGVLGANLGFCWLAYAAISKRLHDMGRSGWWFATGLVGWFIGSFVFALAVALAAGTAALAPDTPTHHALFAFMLLPLVVGLVWLHMAAGDRAHNKYGPVPSTLGFSAPTCA
jgi:uncharacterized membrane protein YhaH (DUF805 family)